MSRVVRVSSDDYKIIVDNGSTGTITLDTTGDGGSIQGTTVIKGSLEVLGTTTTVESETVTIDDNLIILNDGETGAGIRPSFDYKAGIEIDRGTEDNVRLVYDEQSAYYFNGVSGTGSFRVEDANDNFVPFSTNSINSDAALYITTPGSFIDVSGETDYEENVFSYDAPGGVIDNLVPLNDDAVPNAKAIEDYVAFAVATVAVAGISDADTSVVASDFDTNAVESKVIITIDGTVTSTTYSNRTELHNIKIQDNQISTLNDDSTNQDLVLSASGSGNVRVDDGLIITEFPYQGEDAVAPADNPPSEGVKLFASTESAGGTGLYYVNSNGTSDELISKDKALLYAMLF